MDMAFEITEIKNSIKDLAQIVNRLECNVNAMALNDTSFVKSNNNIQPACCSKIAFDSKGLVVAGSSLTEDDIPEIHMSKIIELNQSLKDKVDRDDLDSILKGLNKFINRTPIPAGTGTKINYDSNGNVTSSSNLVPNDIPELPITKIKGLANKIELLNNSIKSYDDHHSDNIVTVSYDGMINQLTDRVTKLENILISMTSINVINSRIDQLENRINSIAFKR